MSKGKEIMLAHKCAQALTHIKAIEPKNDTRYVISYGDFLLYRLHKHKLLKGYNENSNLSNIN